jgi:hypothetical protein
MQSTTSLALSQLNADDLTPVPPPGRILGLHIHAVKLIRLTRADHRAQRAMQIIYRCYPALPSGAGRKQAYADWSILLLSLVQALWHLSQEQVVGWATSWSALANACGFHDGVISASQYSRRLRRLGLYPYFVFFVSLVMELVTLGVIRGDDLIIDSTFLRAWSLKDTAAGWYYYRAGQKAERFGFKVHTILCRWSTLPVLFVVTPANWHDSVLAIQLFRAVKALYGFSIRIIRADAAYWNYAFLGFIRDVLRATFVIDYNLRRSGKKFLAELFFLSQWKHHLGKRSVIERFFAFAKRYYRLKYFQLAGMQKVTQHVLAVYFAVLLVAQVAHLYQRDGWMLSPAHVLAHYVSG